MRILLAEDDRNLNKALTWQLTGQGYNVDTCYDGEDALYYGKQNIYDVILLDRMLPFQEGTEVLSSLRRHGVTAPVILITALGALKDKILGLDLGADDYLSKPFNPMEAMARINSNIRRFYSLGAKSRELKQLTVKDLRLDTESCLVYKNDEPIDLTSVEYKLLRLFMEHPGKVYTKQQVYENVWGEAYAIADNNIMVCISRLRAKLSQDSGAYIKTIRGLGYRMEK